MPDPEKSTETDEARLAVVEASNALGDFMRAHPEIEAALTEDEDAGFARLRDAGPFELNAAWKANLLRIAARDLTGRADMRTTSAALSRLADAVLARGLELAREEIPGETRLAVVAMGKTGAEELNYVSDVDVVFVAEGDLDHPVHASGADGRGQVLLIAVQHEVGAGLRRDAGLGVVADRGDHAGAAALGELDGIEAHRARSAGEVAGRRPLTAPPSSGGSRWPTYHSSTDCACRGARGRRGRVSPRPEGAPTGAPRSDPGSS